MEGNYGSPFEELDRILQQLSLNKQKKKKKVLDSSLRMMNMEKQNYVSEDEYMLGRNSCASPSINVFERALLASEAGASPEFVRAILMSDTPQYGMHSKMVGKSQSMRLLSEAFQEENEALRRALNSLRDERVMSMREMGRRYNDVYSPIWVGRECGEEWLGEERDACTKEIPAQGLHRFDVHKERRQHPKDDELRFGLGLELGLGLEETQCENCKQRMWIVERRGEAINHHNYRHYRLPAKLCRNCHPLPPPPLPPPPPSYHLPSHFHSHSPHLPHYNHSPSPHLPHYNHSPSPHLPHYNHSHHGFSPPKLHFLPRPSPHNYNNNANTKSENNSLTSTSLESSKTKTSSTTNVSSCNSSSSCMPDTMKKTTQRKKKEKMTMSRLGFIHVLKQMFFRISLKT